MVWVSEYQWTTPIVLGIRVPMNDPHWFGYQNTNEWTPLAGYQNTNEQPPLVWVSEYQRTTLIGLGIRIPMNDPHWLGIRVPMNNPHWFGYQNQFIVNLSIIIFMKSQSLTKIYLIQVHIYTYIIIYLVFKYICDISIFFTLNQYS